MLHQRIQSRAKSVEVDQEWGELFEYQQHFRIEHNITVNHILKAFDLPLSLGQYLYSRKCIPSRKSGTLGALLRHRLKQLSSGNVLTVSNDLTDDRSFQVREFFETHCTRLQDIGVETLHLSDNGTTLIIGNTPSIRGFNEYAFQQMAISCPPIGSLTYKVERFVDLAYFSSPMCTKTTNGYGTATMVHLEQCVVAMTARHVVVSDEQTATLCDGRNDSEQTDIDYFDVTKQTEKIHAEQAKNHGMLEVPAATAHTAGSDDACFTVYAVPPPVPPMVRYRVPSHCHVLPILGGCDRHDMHDLYDLAVIHPLSRNAYSANMFANGMTFFCDQESLLRYAYRDKIVMKFGEVRVRLKQPQGVSRFCRNGRSW